MIFSCEFALLPDGCQVGGDVVHVFVVRIIHDQQHFLMRFLRVINDDLRHAVIPCERPAGAVGEGDDNEEVVTSQDAAFQFLAVGQRYSARAASSESSATTATA